MKTYSNLIQDVSMWRLNHLDEHKVLLILSFIIGLVSGFTTVLLKNLIHILGNFLTRDFTSYSENYLYLAYPGIGILITVHLSYRSMTVLIGCGAAGAIAGIFKAPLAGVLFAIEVLMLDLTMASLLPLMISAATGHAASGYLTY